MTAPADRPSGPSTAVVGGGAVGLAAAEALRIGGAAVTLYEKERALGGLLTGTEVGGAACDRFYHVVLPSDRETLAWLERLGLADRLTWSTAGSGFFGAGRLAPLATAGDFLRFPFLSLPRKVRLGLGILAAAAVRDAARPASVSAEAWLRRTFGPAVSAGIWMPLLRSKLGGAASRTSAVFIWSSIRRLLSARRGAAARESWGGVKGGLRGAAAASESRLRLLGAEVRTGCPIEAVEPLDDGRVRLRFAGGEAVHDAVLVTIPGPEAGRLLPAGSEAARVWSGVEYLGLTAVVALLRRPLSPYYILNLLDESLPFTGVIEATNVLPASEVGGASLVYLPKYEAAGEKAPADDAAVKAAFLDGLKKVFPDFRDGDVLDARVERTAWAQPIHKPGPLDPFPAEALRPAPGVFVADTALLTRTVSHLDAALKLGRETGRAILDGFGLRPDSED